MLNVIQVLMTRDCLTQEEAEEQVAECRSAIYTVLDSDTGETPEDVVMDMLQLEPDYLFEILNGI